MKPIREQVSQKINPQINLLTVKKIHIKRPVFDLSYGCEFRATWESDKKSHRLKKRKIAIFKLLSQREIDTFIIREKMCLEIITSTKQGLC